MIYDMIRYGMICYDIFINCSYSNDKYCDYVRYADVSVLSELAPLIS